ncbi:MAG: LysR family transcriptional regulator [Rhodobacteraceae bacterium]|nr:LysR family transcriptional regulator [Paracoccaceae bacterium]
MPRSLDIDQLKAFIAVAETGSFSRAAEEVHRTQAAVSVQMKRLEEAVGAQLIDRQPRQSRLTPAGDTLLAFAYRIRDLNRDAFDALRGPDLSGVIRIGAPLYLPPSFPEILRSLSEAHPNIEVSLHVQESARMVASLEGGELDLAIVTHASSGGVGEVVRREPMHWVVGPGAAPHKDVTIPLAVYHASSALRTQAIETLERLQRPYRIAYSSASTAALCVAVEQGLAVSLLPECAISADMRRLTPEDGFPEPAPIDLSMIAARGADGPLLRSVQQVLRACLCNLVVEPETHDNETA